MAHYTSVIIVGVGYASLKRHIEERHEVQLMDDVAKTFLSNHGIVVEGDIAGLCISCNGDEEGGKAIRQASIDAAVELCRKRLIALGFEGGVPRLYHVLTMRV